MIRTDAIHVVVCANQLLRSSNQVTVRPPRRQPHRAARARQEPKPPATFRVTASGRSSGTPGAAPVGDLQPGRRRSWSVLILEPTDLGLGRSVAR